MSSQTFDNLLLLRRYSLTRRSHTVPVVKQQTVAEHSYQAMMLAFPLYEHLPNKADINLSLVVEHLAYHDLPEGFTGDIPAPAKWQSNKLNEALAEIEGDWYNQNLPQALNVETEMTPADWEFAKLCDMLEFMFYVVDELTFGNRHVLPEYFKVQNKLKEKEQEGELPDIAISLIHQLAELTQQLTQ